MFKLYSKTRSPLDIPKSGHFQYIFALIFFFSIKTTFVMENYNPTYYNKQLTHLMYYFVKLSCYVHKLLFRFQHASSMDFIEHCLMYYFVK